MTVAALFNVPTNPQELALWSFVHAAHHIDIVRLIQQNYGQTLSSFILQPFDPKDGTFDTWIYQHQVMHEQMDRILGIQGFDLTEVDWQDAQGLAWWITQNANEHVQAGTILKLG